MRGQSGPSTSIFVGGYALSRDMVAAIAESASAWRIAPVGNAVAAGPNWLSVHPSRSGSVPPAWTVPPPSRPRLPLRSPPPRGTEHKLTLQAGNTYWFKIEE